MEQVANKESRSKQVEGDQKRTTVLIKSWDVLG